MEGPDKVMLPLDVAFQFDEYWPDYIEYLRADRVCKWKLDQGYWATECGNYSGVSKGYKFCQFCGGKLEVTT